MNALLGPSIIECIQKYTPDQQDQVILYSHCPYPVADGSGIRTALKNASLNRDEIAVKVLLFYLRAGAFEWSEEDIEARLACIKEARKEIKNLASSDARFDGILRHLASTKKFLVDELPKDSPPLSSRDQSPPSRFARSSLGRAFDNDAINSMIRSCVLEGDF